MHICYLIIILLMVIINLQRCFNVLLAKDVFWKGASIAQCSDGLQAEQLGFDFQQGQEVFLCSTASKPTLGFTEPPIQWGLRVFWLGHKADH
jgi:hypothetical protein